MAKCHKYLNSLITSKRIYFTKLPSSIQSDWLPWILTLMNQELVKTQSIFNALKYKDVQHQSQPEMATSVFSKKTFSKHTQHMFDSNIKPQKCFPCNFEGHNLKKCNNNQCLLTENKAKKTQQLSSKDQPKSSNKPNAQASITSAASTCQEEDDSDYLSL